MPAGFCDYCTLPLPKGKRAGTRFCDDGCRARYHGRPLPGPKGLRPKKEEITVPRPTLAGLAYLAGVVDGEGCFATPKTGPGIVVCMADVPVLVWLHEHFSGALSNAYTPPGNSRPRKIWALCRQADLLYLLPRLRPYLVLKGDECDLMLELVTLIRSRKSYNFTDEFIADRDALRMAIRAAIRSRK